MRTGCIKRPEEPANLANRCPEWQYREFRRRARIPATLNTAATPLVRANEHKAPSAILPGTVEKIIKYSFPSQAEEAQLTVEGGDHLYREIRIDNTLTNDQGEEVSLKPGAHVEVTVAAEANETTPKAGDKTHIPSATATGRDNSGSLGLASPRG